VGGGRRKRPGASDGEKRTAAKTTTEGKGQELVGTVPNLPGGPEKAVDEGKGQGVVVGKGWVDSGGWAARLDRSGVPGALCGAPRGRVVCEYR
jgi:hypothetical protein